MYRDAFLVYVLLLGLTWLLASFAVLSIVVADAGVPQRYQRRFWQVCRGAVLAALAVSLVAGLW